MRVKNLSEIIENFLLSIPSFSTQKSVFMSIESLTKTVKRLNSFIQDSLKSNNHSIDYLISLSQRMNHYFIRFT